MGNLVVDIGSPELNTHAYSTLEVFRIEALGTLKRSKGVLLPIYIFFSLPLLYFAVFDGSESYPANTTRLELVENRARTITILKKIVQMQRIGNSIV
jgi:hypothetical protein